MGMLSWPTDDRRRRRIGLTICAALALILAATQMVLATTTTRAQRTGPIITTPTPTPSPTPRPRTQYETLLLTPAALRRGQIVFLPLVFHAAERRPAEVPADRFTYTVRPGDTFWTLALDFGRDLDTMACATTPRVADVEALTAGQQITVPALRDLCYTVTPGDTLESIARRHGLTVAEIVAVPWNGLQGPTDALVPGQRILLPGARPNVQPRPDHRQISIMADDWAQTSYRDWPYGDGHFIWPVVGPISQYAHEGHWALDIAVPQGTPVRAADRGTVVMAGWSPVGYGFRVVIDHGNDYLTLYAHLRDIYVEKGQVVGKGQTIAASGSNGNITGPHLHFEIRDFGALIDPLALLPK